MREKLEICEKSYKVLPSIQVRAVEDGNIKNGEKNVQRAFFRVEKHIYPQNQGESLPNRLNKEKSIPDISQCNSLNTQN